MYIPDIDVNRSFLPRAAETSVAIVQLNTRADILTGVRDTLWNVCRAVSASPSSVTCTGITVNLHGTLNTVIKVSPANVT